MLDLFCADDLGVESSMVVDLRVETSMVDDFRVETSRGRGTRIRMRDLSKSDIRSSW